MGRREGGDDGQLTALVGIHIPRGGHNTGCDDKQKRWTCALVCAWMNI